MNIMNAGKGRFLEQTPTLAEKIGPENEHPIKNNEDEVFINEMFDTRL